MVLYPVRPTLIQWTVIHQNRVCGLLQYSIAVFLQYQLRGSRVYICLVRLSDQDFNAFGALKWL